MYSQANVREESVLRPPTRALPSVIGGKTADGESREEPEDHKRERLDGLARITLEEHAITHFVKNGTLQNACSTRPRVGKVLIRTSSG